MSTPPTPPSTSLDCPWTKDELASIQSLLPYATEQELADLRELLTGQSSMRRPAATTEAMDPTEPPTVPASPAALGKIVWGDRWHMPAHLAMLNEKLVGVAEKRIRRLLVMMPPRHGKSLLASENFPAWYLGKNPDHRIILASYGADFAAEWGRKARNLLEEFGPSLFGVSVSSDSSAADRWDVAGHRGGMITAGVGGAITGRGADVLLLDDPIKNAEEANSFAHRQKVWDWYQSVAYTRLEPDGCVVLIQTRWNGDDLAGRLLKEMKARGELWEVLNLPAISGGNDPIGRQRGEPLWPERFSLAMLERIRTAVGQYVWAALYQQDPMGDEGNQIKREWFRYYQMQGDYYQLFEQPGNPKHTRVIHKRDCERFAIVDCAAISSEEVAAVKRGKAPSVGVISTFDFHRQNGYLMVVDVWYGFWGFPELVQRTNQVLKELGPAWIGIEDEKTGHALLQVLRALPVRAISHEGKSKLTRAARLLNEMERGKVFSNRYGGWLLETESELLAWTGHPDERFNIGDTWAYAGIHADRKGGELELIFDGPPGIGGFGPKRGWG